LRPSVQGGENYAEASSKRRSKATSSVVKLSSYIVVIPSRDTGDSKLISTISQEDRRRGGLDLGEGERMIQQYMCQKRDEKGDR